MPFIVTLKTKIWSSIEGRRDVFIADRYQLSIDSKFIILYDEDDKEFACSENFH